jgi:soluble lytic murein transglycosylase-like protein
VRRRRLCVLIPSALFSFAAPPAALADVAHVVRPGETLWSIAAANNLTTRTVAAYNGLSEDHHVVLGSTIRVPTVAEGQAALAGTGAAPAATTSSATSTASGAPAPQGAYIVRWGDTLSSLAAGAGVSLSDMAAMNGLDPDGVLLAGTVLKLPAGAPPPARSAEPTPARLSAGDVQTVAAEHGVSPSLAAAIAWQESGFNNGMVSDANARGVMQVMPGTWEWVQSHLATRALDPNSATDNVHAGVLYLKRLLADTGGDENAAIAGYYQGLASVQSRGMFDDTKQYVANVQALRSRFGG